MRGLYRITDATPARTLTAVVASTSAEHPGSAALSPYLPKTRENSTVPVTARSILV